MNTGRILSACLAVCLTTPLAVAQLPVTGLSGRAVETLIPPEFEGESFNRIGAIVIRAAASTVSPATNWTVQRVAFLDRR